MYAVERLLIGCFFFVSSKSQAQFQSMEVRNANFAAFIDVFTTNTYIMVITSDLTVRMYLK
jgi:Ras-related GTP-binding protein A/B